ncbi:Phage integrase family protein [Oleispira antarctica RB-8]|uniref:Phage integrase family protein n=1 Tax=Oleispira antarctica RB-8 TaxID=698738 RepID=R4YQZ5_OLEAN|nr:Phage integrase family protein [Oleispira antarctica RB-8]
MKYRFLKKEKLLSIGTYPTVSLGDARKARESAKEQLLAGIDPNLAKQQNKLHQHASASNSFKVIAQEWYDKQINIWAPSTATKQLALLNNDIYPYLGQRPISEIETFELVGCLSRIVDRGAIETAHKARQVINQVCRFAKQTGRIKANPASDLAGTIPTQRSKHRAAITEPDDFGRLLVEIDGYQGTNIIRTALALAPLLFQRPGELCGMEWAELDLDKGLWTIPHEKKKERNQIEGDHIVPLCQQALYLLNDLKPLTGHGKQVFPNQRSHQQPIRTESLNKALRKLGYDTKTKQCAHGFRASARTMLDEQLQLRIEWIEHQLAHKVKDSLGNAYNRTKHLPARIDMMQRWADYMDNLKRQTLAGNVVTGTFGR